MPQISHCPRVIAIGDIHGCATALRVLIEAIEPQAGDTIIPLGDVVDYGPDSRDVIEQLMQLARIVRLIPLRGNHEDMFLSVVDDRADPEKWLRFGGDATLAAYGATDDWSRVPADHLEFLRAGRLIYETDTHFFVHANYYPNQRLSMYEETLAASTDLELLGIPRSWWFVHRGLHPFSPERTVIISGRPEVSLLGQARQQVLEHFAKMNYPREIDAEALDAALHMAAVMAASYRRPESLDDWAARFAMWVLYWYPFCGAAHLFVSPMSPQQHPEPVQTMNGLVDWWLFLLPQGIDVGSSDGTRIHVLVAPVFARYEFPRNHGEYFHLMSRALWDTLSEGPANSPSSDRWVQVARMNRQEACLTLNERLARFLRSASEKQDH